MPINAKAAKNDSDRRHFIGGSDARIIMGQDEKAVIRLSQSRVESAAVWHDQSEAETGGCDAPIGRRSGDC
jgi:predicted phage-related endonuclease